MMGRGNMGRQVGSPPAAAAKGIARAQAVANPRAAVVGMKKGGKAKGKGKGKK